MPSSCATLRKSKGKAVKACLLADRNTAMKVKQEGDKLTVALPKDAPDKIASVLCVGTRHEKAER